MYDRDVFINCPFDAEYEEVLRAIVFAVHDCGFRARSALESADAAKPRIVGLKELISQCRLGIHDISRTEIDGTTGLPRFNVPLELGMFFGARQFGDQKQRRKICLVLDRERYRYRDFCSDLSGQDVVAHRDDLRTVIRVVRNWLGHLDPETILPGAGRIHERYLLFKKMLPSYLGAIGVEPAELTHTDYTFLVSRWLRLNP